MLSCVFIIIWEASARGWFFVVRLSEYTHSTQHNIVKFLVHNVNGVKILVIVKTAAAAAGRKPVHQIQR